MKDALVAARNSATGFMYKNLVKHILFRYDPEFVHDRAIGVGRFFGSNAVTRLITRIFFGYSNRGLRQVINGIEFSNPVGLAAGFDKNAEMAGAVPGLGFGFEEVGSVTAEPCEGNPRPRLWRLVRSRSLVVYYGLKNDGCEVIYKRMIKGIGKKGTKKKRRHFPYGINIAYTNSRENSAMGRAIADYAKTYRKFAKLGDYTTLNLSCPNTYDDRYVFLKGKNLARLMAAIRKIRSGKPVFIKISPDMRRGDVDSIIKVAQKFGVDGIICGNLTKKRKNSRIVEKSLPEKGGISGKAVEELSNEMIRHVYIRTKGSMTIVGCGGVFTAEDAYKKIKLGASLVQLITGMIFEGPQAISEINRGLVKLMKKDGFTNISQAVGKDVRH